MPGVQVSRIEMKPPDGPRVTYGARYLRRYYRPAVDCAAELVDHAPGTWQGNPFWTCRGCGSAGRMLGIWWCHGCADRREHFEVQAQRYAKLSGEHGRDLAAYLARRRELVTERDDARRKAEAAATDHEAGQQQDEAADWREAAHLAHLALVDLRRS